MNINWTKQRKVNTLTSSQRDVKHWADWTRGFIWGELCALSGRHTEAGRWTTKTLIIIRWRLQSNWGRSITDCWVQSVNLMRFFKGGGCPATPTLAPHTCDLKPFKGLRSQRVRGAEDGYVDEGWGVGTPAWATHPAFCCYCLTRLLPLNFTRLSPAPQSP